MCVCVLVVFQWLKTTHICVLVCLYVYLSVCLSEGGSVRLSVCRVVSCRVSSCRLGSCHVVSRGVDLCHVGSYYIVTCHVTWCCVKSCHLMLSYPDCVCVLCWVNLVRFQIVMCLMCYIICVDGFCWRTFSVDWFWNRRCDALSLLSGCDPPSVLRYNGYAKIIRCGFGVPRPDRWQILRLDIMMGMVLQRHGDVRLSYLLSICVQCVFPRNMLLDGCVTWCICDPSVEIQLSSAFLQSVVYVLLSRYYVSYPLYVVCVLLCMINHFTSAYQITPGLSASAQTYGDL